MTDKAEMLEDGVEAVETIAEAAATAAQEQLTQDKFEKCPCGEVPTDLIINLPRGSKYGTVQGNCCAVWSMEFKAGYPKDQGDLQMIGMMAWNSATRG